MLMIDHPEVIDTLKSFRGGLIPFRDSAEHKIRLVIKVSVGAIHSSILKGFIKFYVTLLSMPGGFIPVLNTAFFDDHDEPYVLTTPVFNELFDDFGEMLSYTKLDIHILDEHNREWGAFVATLETNARNPFTRDDLLLPEFSADANEKILAAGRLAFGSRTPKHDLEATMAILGKNSLPDNLYYIDATFDSNQYHGGSGVVVSDLERKNPGAYQETDIAICLSNVQDLEIFVNPARFDNSKEIADLIAFAPGYLFVVQAKDNPNDRNFLEKSLDRKASVGLKHLVKAARQTIGALTYIRQSADGSLSFSMMKEDVKRTSKNHVELNVSHLQVIPIIVVREIYHKYGSKYMDLISDVRKINGHAIILDYFSFYSFCKIASISTELAELIREFSAQVNGKQSYPNPEEFIISYLGRNLGE